VVENELQIIHVGVGKNQTKTLGFELHKQMKKTILIIGIVGLMLLSTVTAFRDVTCGHGMIGGLCHENELQDEFNQLENMVNNLEYLTEDDKTELQEDLNDLANEVTRLRQVSFISDRILLFKIKTNERKIHRMKHRLNNLDNRLDVEEAEVDQVGGGTSFRRVERWALNDFTEWLKGLFASHDQADKCMAYAKHNGDSDWDMINWQGLEKAERTGETQYPQEGVECHNGMSKCIIN